MSNSKKHKKNCKKQKYYILVSEFLSSLIQIPTSNVSTESTTTDSLYIAGKSNAYDVDGKLCGNCSATFICINNGLIYTDISNFLTIDNGLIISWLTPTVVANLAYDSIVNGMVTECIVSANTKINKNPFYGKTYNMIVSTEKTDIGDKVWFKLKEIKHK